MKPIISSIRISAILFSGIALLSLLASTLPVSSAKQQLKQVKYWAYQLQWLDRKGAVDKLVDSGYDMLVLEPTRSDRDSADFDTKGMVERLHATPGKHLGRRLVIAYIDIGEAEDWRWYWEKSWRAPKKKSRGNPDFILAVDPDGWEGNYPVAFWDDRWQDIMIYGANSALNQVIADGFDGIYMDWVEAYSDKHVKKAAVLAGVDPAEEMVKFIRRIRKYARKKNPNFLVIQQNATDLWEGNKRLFKVVDAIAQEHVYFNGEADTNWNDSASGDKRVPSKGKGYSRSYYQRQLKQWLKRGFPVFNCEYARKPNNVEDAYSLSLKQGYIPYVSLTPLSRLTGTPPPGY